jgi:hypothetical protein
MLWQKQHWQETAQGLLFAQEGVLESIACRQAVLGVEHEGLVQEICKLCEKRHEKAVRRCSNTMQTNVYLRPSFSLSLHPCRRGAHRAASSELAATEPVHRR